MTLLSAEFQSQTPRDKKQKKEAANQKPLKPQVPRDQAETTMKLQQPLSRKGVLHVGPRLHPQQNFVAIVGCDFPDRNSALRLVKISISQISSQAFDQMFAQTLLVVCESNHLEI